MALRSCGAVSILDGSAPALLLHRLVVWGCAQSLQQRHVEAPFSPTEVPKRRWVLYLPLAIVISDPGHTCPKAVRSRDTSRGARADTAGASAVIARRSFSTSMLASF